MSTLLCAVSGGASSLEPLSCPFFRGPRSVFAPRPATSAPHSMSLTALCRSTLPVVTGGVYAPYLYSPLSNFSTAISAQEVYPDSILQQYRSRNGARCEGGARDAAGSGFGRASSSDREGAALGGASHARRQLAPPALFCDALFSLCLQ